MRVNKLRRFTFFTIALALSISLSSCNRSSSDSSASNDSDLSALDTLFNSTPNVDLVKTGNIEACPTATLEEMADAFMSNSNWSEFSSTTGSTVVELEGTISYDGSPATAKIQFEVSGSSFKAVYLGINEVDQNLLVLSTLLDKMCEAA